MQNNLPELRDIHLPTEGVSFFPPAYGWWIILGVSVVSIVSFFAIRHFLRKSKKRYARKLLAELDMNQISSAVKMSEILRRICIYKYPSAAVLFGKEWIDFLNAHTTTPINDKAAQLLMYAPYVGENSSTFDLQDLSELSLFCQKWIGENL